jgi:hypothetical protein
MNTRTFATLTLFFTLACGCNGDEPEAGSAQLASNGAGVHCGNTTCTESLEIPQYGASYPACCDLDSDMMCGAMLDDGCEALHQKGEPSPSCPGTISAVGTELQGCCRPDGRCGVLSQIGFGCVERSDLNPSVGGPLASMPCSP